VQTAQKQTAEPVAAGSAVFEGHPGHEVFAGETVAHASDRVHEGGLDAEIEAVARLIVASLDGAA
jgi:hypothetical protein